MRCESVDVAIAPVISLVFPQQMIVLIASLNLVAIAPVISQFPLLGQVIVGFGTSTEADPLSGSLEEFCTLRTNATLPRYQLKIKKEAFHF